MKKNTLIFVSLLFLIIAVGCSKKDDSTPTIQGKWMVSSAHYQIFTNNSLTGDTTIAAAGNEYFEFLGDGTMNEKDADGNIYTYQYNYNESSRKLTLEEDGFTYVYDVTTLTQNTLVIYSEEEETYDGITSQYTTEFTLSR